MSNSVAWDRLVRYQPNDNSQPRYGQPILKPGDVDEIARIADEGQLDVEILEGTHPLEARPSGQIERVGKLLGPLTPKDVPIIRCIGLNYKTHILEAGRGLPACPTIFTKPSPAVNGHNEDVPVPKVAQSQCDYEGELVILIGRDAKNVTEADALDYVAAYTAGNDISARDWQREPEKAGSVPQWTFSKSFDKYAPVGPCLVASHVLGDADGLSLRTTVNGQQRQQSNTADFCFGVRKLVAFCSRGQTLQRGSLIMTGTPGGVGLFMKPPTFLAEGDQVRVSIGGIGELSNRITFE